MPTDQVKRREDRIEFSGRILFLTEDTSLIRRQLEASGSEAKALEDELAQRLMNDDLPLMNNISTDEITPDGFVFITTRRWGNTFTLGCVTERSRKTKLRMVGLSWSFPVCRKAVA